MSSLKVDTIQNRSGGGTNVKIGNTSTYVSENSTTTQNAVQGLTKAWCFFDGTAGTIAPADSYNVANLTDSTAGEYGVNFTNNMSNANYSRYATAGATNASSVGGESSANATSTSSCRIKAVKPTIAVADDSKVSCGINGDLA